MFKKFINLFLLLILTNCSAPGTALLGPSITVARTGSVYQAGLSYGSSHIVKKTKQSLEKFRETKIIVYQRVDQLHKKITKDKLDLLSKFTCFGFNMHRSLHLFKLFCRVYAFVKLSTQIIAL